MLDQYWEDGPQKLIGWDAVVASIPTERLQSWRVRSETDR
jgi:hypothetical protein